MRRAYFKNNWVAAALVAPQLLIIFVFFYWPTTQAVFWSFTFEQPWGGGNEWAGLHHFRELLSDPLYWQSIRVSIVYAAGTTTLGIGIALMLALFADRQLRGYRTYRIAVIWPYAVSAPAIGLAFRYVFNPNAGIMSYLNAAWPGIWDPILTGWHAMLMIIVAGAWKNVAYNFIFLLAGLQAIPRSLVEASAMDGARWGRRMRDIQLPLLAPSFFFILVMNITDSFTDSFGIVDMMTDGGPARATNLMVYKIYSDGFEGQNYSSAAAQSVILMLLVIGLTFFQFRYIERKIHYT